MIKLNIRDFIKDLGYSFNSSDEYLTSLLNVNNTKDISYCKLNIHDEYYLLYKQNTSNKDIFIASIITHNDIYAEECYICHESEIYNFLHIPNTFVFDNDNYIKSSNEIISIIYNIYESLDDLLYESFNVDEYMYVENDKCYFNCYDAFKPLLEDEATHLNILDSFKSDTNFVEHTNECIILKNAVTRSKTGNAEDLYLLKTNIKQLLNDIMNINIKNEKYEVCSEIKNFLNTL